MLFQVFRVLLVLNSLKFVKEVRLETVRKKLCLTYLPFQPYQLQPITSDFYTSYVKMFLVCGIFISNPYFDMKLPEGTQKPNLKIKHYNF